MEGQTQQRILLRQSEMGKDDHGKSKRRRMKESERKQKKSNDMMRLEEDAHHSSRCFKWCLTAIASPEMDEDSVREEARRRRCFKNKRTGYAL
ncbi:hypothetical protein GCK72_018146 [Caenorhabditis remanei]|uniref:Uncharacterized protein n=1 Tax=Caenorhabditis remanei TaxID=31234 RepID=A0A6A5GAL6_CAERE|nr:hypothetical protein GCK72_018146 [Caenorhabditis remanei]KAF1751592.1 hypothetical protein GCK72_018146 [Caenorhabditis remanei]